MNPIKIIHISRFCANSGDLLADISNIGCFFIANDMDE